MIRRPPRSTLVRSSAASDVYKRQPLSVYASAGSLGNAAAAVLVAAFLFMSAPVSAHLVIKAVLKNESDRHRLPPSRPDSASDSRPVSR